MRNLLKKLPGIRALPSDLSYEGARNALEAQDKKAKRELAARADAPPEALYYLATDASPEVRRLAAANEATPRQADLMLCQDVDEDVRCELARKISRLIPGLEGRVADKVRDLTLQALDQLSQDHLPRVRSIIAEELRASADAPKSVMLRLAQDAEEIVAAPVLEYSPLLNDQDLMELVAAGLATGMLQAVARRQNLAEPVCDQVAATFDAAAIASLLQNASAKVRVETLEQIAAQAEEMSAVHEPLAMRPDLSVKAIRRIAGFLATSLVERLAARNDLDEDTQDLLSRHMRRKVEDEPAAGEGDAVSRALEVVEKAAKRSELTEAFVVDALDAGDRPLARVALAALAKVKLGAVDQILAAKAAKPLVALVWKAGLSMRTASLAQEKLGAIKPSERLPARGGSAYPLADDEMNWLIDYFTDA
ncbi:MAG: DUF2336 domain-containing protein [Pseudomonadota bacterium]